MLENIMLKILHRIHPSLLWYMYTTKSQKIFKKSHFILSFDCDTEEDIKVAGKVHSKLQEMGITAVYAVPGELLKKGKKVYKEIYQTGAEFINHGGREHTYFDTTHNRHASCFFYDQQPFEVLKDDIIQGHQALQNILGITPIGWRTPHFGTFQKSEHLKFLASLLKELGYKFSTSTAPEMAYRFGPIYKQNSMIEIPVTGIIPEPFNIMDTWGYFAAPDRNKAPSDYVTHALQLADLASRHPILINIYGDPSHIHDRPEFFQAMAILIQKSKNVNYTQLIEIYNRNILGIHND